MTHSDTHIGKSALQTSITHSTAKKSIRARLRSHVSNSWALVIRYLSHCQACGKVLL